MNSNYLINDTRLLIDFKDKTFSGYKKSDLFNILFKSIDKNKIESACNWITECLISGYTLPIFEKLLIYSCKVVHINNPRLPFYLLNKAQIIDNQMKRLNVKNKDIVLLLRNSQMIRNLFFDLITTLCTSSKTKKYDKIPKIAEEDFDFHNLRNRLCATMNYVPQHIIHFNDPEELKIIINEFFYNLKNPLNGYEKCIYWVLWIVKWEELHKKKKDNWQVDARDVPLKDRLKYDVIWVIWDSILEEIKCRKQNNTKDINCIEKQVDALFHLFLLNYSSGKRSARLPYVFLAIGYLTLKTNFEIPVRNNTQAFIQSQSNVNKMFESKKINEIKKEIIQPEAVKKVKKADTDIMKSKISAFNDITF